MSIHRSLVTQGKLTRHRNVLTRAERLQILLEGGTWKAGDSPFCLPKVRNQKHKVKKTKKKEEAATEAVPAAGAKAAAGGAKAAEKPAAGKGPAKQPAKK